jgi:hypothetical protein
MPVGRATPAGGRSPGGDTHSCCNVVAVTLVLYALASIRTRRGGAFLRMKRIPSRRGRRYRQCSSAIGSSRRKPPRACRAGVAGHLALTSHKRRSEQRACRRNGCRIRPIDRRCDRAATKFHLVQTAAPEPGVFLRAGFRRLGQAHPNDQ